MELIMKMIEKMLEYHTRLSMIQHHLETATYPSEAEIKLILGEEFKPKGKETNDGE